MLLAVVVFILLLLMLVLAHEWGHFFTARRLGVAVEEFGFGFPPRAASFQRGQTKYSLNWLPLGGFVKLKGEAGERRSEPDSFAAQAAWRRVVILVAGVAMNVVLAWFLLSLGYLVGVPTSVADHELAAAHNLAPQVIGVVDGSPAAAAGLARGDAIISLNSKPVVLVTEVQNFLAEHAGTAVELGIRRGSQLITSLVTPEQLPEGGGRAIIGVRLLQTGTVSYPWYQALWYGLMDTGTLSWEIAKAFGGMLRDLVVERTVPRDVAGPVGIAVLTGQVTDLGFSYLIQFAALLSINLALINILPFPALDGGRVLFVIIEKLRGRPNDQKVEAMVHNIGFVLLMLLVLIITFHDIARLWSA